MKSPLLKVLRWTLEIVALWIGMLLVGPIVVYLDEGAQGLKDHPIDAELVICLAFLAVFFRFMFVLWGRLFGQIEASVVSTRVHARPLSRKERERGERQQRMRAKREASKAAFEAVSLEKRRQFGPTGNQLRALNRRFEHLTRLPTVIQ